MKLEHSKTVSINPPEEPIVVIHSSLTGENGAIYLSDEFNHRVLIVSNDSTISIGKKGNENGNFWYPRGLCLVNTGNRKELFVCDSWNHRIQRFTTDGEYISGFGSIGSGNDHFDEPVTLIAADGGVFILDRCNHRIVKTGFDGTPITSFGSHLTLDDEDRLNDPADLFLKQINDPLLSFGFNYPCDFTQNQNGDFFVADTGNRRICQITSDGRFKNIITLDNGESPLYFPVSITITSDGLILVESTDKRLKLIWGDDYEFCEEVSHPAQDGVGKFISGASSGDGRDTVLTFKDNSLESYLIPSKPSEIKSIMIGEMSEKMGIGSIPAFTNRIEKMQDEALIVDDVLAFAHKSVELAGPSLQKMQNLEQEYWTTAKAFLEKDINRQTGTTPQEGLSPQSTSEKASLDFQAATQLGKRRAERKLFTGALAGAAKALKHLHERASDDSVDKEIKAYRDILKKEFDTANADYEQTISLLKERLGDIKSLDLGTALVACIGLIILHDYMRVYTACDTALLSGSKDKRLQLPDLPEPLAPFNKDIRPIAHSVIFTLGGLCREWGLFQSAARMYEGMLSHPNDNLRQIAHIHMSQICTAEKRFPESVELLEKARQISDSLPLPLMQELCEAQFKLGRLDEVLKSGKAMYEIVRDEPDSPYFKSTIVFSLHSLIILGEFDKAIEFINAVPEERIIPEIIHFLVATYQLNENENEAIDGLRGLIDKYPKMNNIRRELAVRLGLSGDMQGALDAIKWEKENSSDIVNTMIESCIFRFVGKHDESLKILGKERREALNFLPVAMEFLINAYAAQSNNDMEEAMESVLRLCGNESFFSNYIYSPKSQRELVEKVLSQVQERFAKTGGKMAIKKLNRIIYQYVIFHEYNPLDRSKV